MINIVVLIYSKKGSTLQLAEEVCKGIDSVNNVKAKLRRVDELKQTQQQRMLEKYEKVQVITKKGYNGLSWTDTGISYSIRKYGSRAQIFH